MKTFAKFLLVFASLAVALSACSKNDNSIDRNSIEIDDYNDVTLLQNYLVRLDSLGNFLYRVNGKTLESDTTILYMCAEDINEVLSLLKTWLPNVEVDTKSVPYELPLTGRYGSYEGSAYINPNSTAKLEGYTAVADMTFDSRLIKYVSKVLFFTEAAWSKHFDGLLTDSNYAVGQAYKMYSNFDGYANFVCVQNSRAKGCVFFRTSNEILHFYSNFDLCSSISDAQNILPLINGASWNSTVNACSVAGISLDADEYYWLSNWKHTFWADKVYAVRLKDGDMDLFTPALRSKRALEVRYK